MKSICWQPVPLASPGWTSAKHWCRVHASSLSLVLFSSCLVSSGLFSLSEFIIDCRAVLHLSVPWVAVLHLCDLGMVGMRRNLLEEGLLDLAC